MQSCCCKYLTVPLFHSGIMRSGLNAIMGPTGSGKTTYVRSLCIYSYVFILPQSYFKAPKIIYCVCVCWHRLLDVLADRKGRKGWSGDILVNGKRRPKNFKCLCGYVVQVIKHFYS